MGNKLITWKPTDNSELRKQTKGKLLGKLLGSLSLTLFIINYSLLIFSCDNGSNDDDYHPVADAGAGAVTVFSAGGRHLQDDGGVRRRYFSCRR
jgi:hypothetical protein